MKLRLYQFNSTTGRPHANCNKILAALEQAAKASVDLVIFSKGSLTGFMLEDQAHSSLFLETAESYLKLLAEKSQVAAVVSFPDGHTWKNLLIKDGQVSDAAGLLDEYGIALENSPFILGQAKTQQARICLNSVGLQEELFFDGESFVTDGQGNLLAQLKSCEEDYVDVVLDEESLKVLQPPKPACASKIEKIYKVLVLSLRDYMEKNNFKRAVLGLSGGIDSALVATIAADAIGGKNLHCVRLPSMFSSEHSLNDAAAIASKLGSQLSTIPINSLYENFNKTLADLFANRTPDVTEENLQARIRGTLLMSLSNKFGELLLNTGNKSEGSVGYATLYGDTCGGFSVLKDIYKTTVYKLAEWRNENWLDMFYGPKRGIIPENVFVKAPSAELAHGQKDSDSLPEYEILDKILKSLIEKNQSRAEILKEGTDEATLDKVISMLHRSEYKRRQSPPGVVICRKYKKYSL